MVKPQTILLVDDHSLITTAMSALLQSMYPDVQIHVGATAKEAVELAEKYGDSADPVSYTHLTLPTTSRV